jgi:hypothetical protein
VPPAQLPRPRSSAAARNLIEALPFVPIVGKLETSMIGVGALPGSVPATVAVA